MRIQDIFLSSRWLRFSLARKQQNNWQCTCCRNEFRWLCHYFRRFFFFFCCANDTAFEVKRNERTIESRLKRVFRYRISFSACEANIYLDQKTFPIFEMIVPLFVFFFPSANVFYLWLGVVLP